MGTHLLQLGLEVVELDSGLLGEERAAQRGREGQAHATQQYLWQSIVVVRHDRHSVIQDAFALSPSRGP